MRNYVTSQEREVINKIRSIYKKESPEKEITALEVPAQEQLKDKFLKMINADFSKSNLNIKICYLDYSSRMQGIFKKI